MIPSDWPHSSLSIPWWKGSKVRSLSIWLWLDLFYYHNILLLSFELEDLRPENQNVRYLSIAVICLLGFRLHQIMQLKSWAYNLNIPAGVLDDNIYFSISEILDVQPPSSSAQKRNPRAADSPAKGDNGVLSPKFIRQITKSVYAATHKICTSKSQICIKGQKGEPGDWNSISPNSLQPIKGEAGGVVTAPGIQVTPAVSTVGLSETVAFQCSPEKNVVAVISWSKEEGSLPTGRYFIVKGALYIRNTTVGDHGMYVCTIRTDQGTVQASVTLNVKGNSHLSLSW